MNTSKRIDSNLRKIKRFIIIIMILVPFIPMVVILGIGYFYFSTSLTNSGTNTMRRIAQDHGQMIEAFLEERTDDLKFILSVYDHDELSRPELLDRIYVNLIEKSSAFADLGVFNDSGLHIAYHGPHSLAGKNYYDTEWFQEAVHEGAFISDVFLGYRNIPHFIIAVSTEKDHRKIILRATIDTVTFRNLVDNVRIGKTGEAYILNTSGILQTQRRSGGTLMTLDPDALLPLTAHSGTTTFLSKTKAGNTYLNATTWIMDGKWQLVVRQEKGEVFSALSSTAYMVLLTTAIGGAIILLTAFFLAERVVQRIKEAELQKDSLQIQLIRAGRLAELGEMAAGFAHEINNPLQVIKSEQALIESIVDDLKAGIFPVEATVEADIQAERPSIHQADDQLASIAELEDSVQQISQQVERCSDITQSILKFSRKQEPQEKQINLNEFIPEIIKMINKKAQVNGIAVDVRIADKIPPICCDPSQLQQVLLNLLNNAIDAIYSRHGIIGGHLQIEAGPAGDDAIGIKVVDNGSGIDLENQEKIFTPFFSTKPVGEGTGLGLSICFGIISSMGGALTFKSKPGNGSTFYVNLPKTNQKSCGEN